MSYVEKFYNYASSNITTEEDLTEKLDNNENKTFFYSGEAETSKKVVDILEKKGLTGSTSTGLTQEYSLSGITFELTKKTIGSTFQYIFENNVLILNGRDCIIDIKKVIDSSIDIVVNGYKMILNYNSKVRSVINRGSANVINSLVADNDETNNIENADDEISDKEETVFVDTNNVIKDEKSDIDLILPVVENNIPENNIVNNINIKETNFYEPLKKTAEILNIGTGDSQGKPETELNNRENHLNEKIDNEKSCGCYQLGLPFTGLGYDGQMYFDGALADKVSIDGCYYENGEKYTGTVNKISEGNNITTVYENGVRTEETIENNLKTTVTEYKKNQEILSRVVEYKDTWFVVSQDNFLYENNKVISYEEISDNGFCKFVDIVWDEAEDSMLEFAKIGQDGIKKFYIHNELANGEYNGKFYINGVEQKSRI